MPGRSGGPSVALIDRLARNGPVLLDGATGTELERRGIRLEDFDVAVYEGVTLEDILALDEDLVTRFVALCGRYGYAQDELQGARKPALAVSESL